METKPLEWHFRQENSILEGIKQLAIFAPLKLYLLIWLVSTCNGMDLPASKKLQSNADSCRNFSWKN